MKKQIHNFSKLQKKIFIICGVLVLIFISIIFISNINNTEEHKAEEYKTYTYKLEQPELYDGPLIIKTFKNTFSIKPVNAKENVQKIVDEKNPNIIKYIEAYKNTDIVQTRQTNKLKEDIILKQPGHPEKFTYQLDLENYEFEKTNNGDFIFYEKGKKGQELYKIFTIPAPFMIEQKNLGTEELKNERTKDIGEVEMFIEGNKLILTPDKEWIENHNYPIIVDPTIEINILNLHSHPQQGENWEVEFTTRGQADLYIIPNDQATIDDDEFVALYCGEEERTPQILENDVIFYKNWECNQVAKVVHYTLVAGTHTLRFEFGGQVAYAYNDTVSDSFTDETKIASKENLVVTGGQVKLGVQPPCVGAADTLWGAGPSGCDASNERCYDGACIACGGWMDPETPDYCWYAGGNNENCTSVCSTRGGVYQGTCDWVLDPAGCRTASHFTSTDCSGCCWSIPTCAWAPAWNPDGNSCYYHYDGSNDCETIFLGYYRACACDE